MERGIMLLVLFVFIFYLVYTYYITPVQSNRSCKKWCKYLSIKIVSSFLTSWFVGQTVVRLECAAPKRYMYSVMCLYIWICVYMYTTEMYALCMKRNIDLLCSGTPKNVTQTALRIYGGSFMNLCLIYDGGARSDVFRIYTVLWWI